jgi:hypothetical protein
LSAFAALWHLVYTLVWFAHRFFAEIFTWLGAQFFNAEAHIPAQSSPPLEDARIPQSHEDQRWTSRAFAPSGQGAQAGFREPWIS